MKNTKEIAKYDLIRNSKEFEFLEKINTYNNGNSLRIIVKDKITGKVYSGYIPRARAKEETE